MPAQKIGHVRIERVRHGSRVAQGLYADGDANVHLGNVCAISVSWGEAREGYALSE